MLLLWLVIACQYPAMAQHGNIWAIGYKKGLNFNTQPISIINTSIVQDTVNFDADNKNSPALNGSVSYSDCEGNLLVYGSENQLWNKYHKPMKNGYFNAGGGRGYGLILIPKPKSNRYLYLFYHTWEGSICNMYLRYALIDLNGDNGAGEVVYSNRIVGSGASSNLTYAKHSNMSDLWILHGASDKVTNCYLLTDTGVNVTPVVNKNVFTYNNCLPSYKFFTGNYWSGTTFNYAYAMKVTRDRKNIVCSGIDSSTTKMGCVLMYDFNNSTGVISNPQILMKFSDIPLKTGAFQGNYSSNEISPNDSFIYVAEMPEGLGKSTIVQINRFTKQKTTVFNTKNEIWGLGIGPDGKIYFEFFNATLKNIDLYAITKPNLKGSKCAVRKILTDSLSIYFRLAPQVYEPYKQLVFSTSLNDRPCQDTASFSLQIDTSFQNLIVYFGDGDSVKFNSPLKSFYNLKHFYKSTGNYYLGLKAQNPNCNTFSYAGDSFFYAKPPKLINSSKQAIPNCNYALFTLKDSFTNTTRAVYSWSLFKNDTSKIVNNNLFNKILPKDSGWDKLKWKVTLSSRECSHFISYSDSIDINYLNAPQPKLLFVGNVSDTLKSCLPLNVQILDSSKYSSSMHVVWGDKNEISTKQPYLPIKHIYFSSGAYKIFVTDTSKDGCTSIDSLLALVYPNPQTTIKVPLAIQCYQENDFSLIAESNIPVNYSWKLPTKATYTKKNDSVTNLHLANSGYSFSSVYSESLNGCKDTANITLYLMPEIKAVFNGDSTAKCLNNNVFSVNHTKDINTGPVVIDYWYDQINGLFDKISNQIAYKKASVYRFGYSLTDSLGCKDSLEVFHRVFNHPQLKLKTNDTCFGNPVNITFNSDVPLVSNVISTGDGKIYYAPSYHSYKKAGSYTVSLAGVSQQGCKDSTSRTFSIFDKPVAGLISDSVCLGNLLTLLPVCNNIQWDSLFNMSIHWNGSSKIIYSPGKVNIPASIVGPITVQNIVRSKHNCLDTAEVVAMVYDLPVADFTWNRLSSSPAGIEVQFYDRSVNGSNHFWDFGDGQSLNFVDNPLHIFSDSGIYNVIYTVSNKEGCKDEKIDIIRVLPYLPVFIPTAFSPNNDGLNEVFEPSGTLLLSVWNLTIYNRWGEIVYEGNNKGWNGLDSKGENCQSGVYTYRVYTQGIDKKKNFYNGTLHLER